jgi:N-acyl-D-amino-acid deacylase
MIGSDSAGYDDNIIKYKSYEHPRSFGAFTKFLQDFVLTGLLDWQTAISKITSLPARTFGLGDIGIIRENMQADIVIIDPINLQSYADFQQPIQYSVGIEMVIVNGKITLQEEQVIDLEGKIIEV